MGDLDAREEILHRAIDTLRAQLALLPPTMCDAMRSTANCSAAIVRAWHYSMPASPHGEQSGLASANDSTTPTADQDYRTNHASLGTPYTLSYNILTSSSA